MKTNINLNSGGSSIVIVAQQQKFNNSTANLNVYIALNQSNYAVLFT